MSALVLTMLVVPYATAALAAFLGHRSEGPSDGIAKGFALAGSAGGLAITSVVAASHLGAAVPFRHVYAATTGFGPPVQLAVRVDPLSAVLLLLAAGVAFLVQLYSLGYLEHDPRYPSYAALVSLFTGAMTTVVVADDFWMLLVGWEVMGACSYFLIAHHWELHDARAGAVKAFLMTRTADLGLLFGILVLGGRFHSYRISTVMAEVVRGAFPRDDLWLPALLLLLAVVGKSAQFPLHTWLPDAMPGPTPVSALIHAATMVAAGVFLVARTYPLFLSAPTVLTLLAVVSAVTMVLGAVRALFTDDLKRVLAWSTVSQLAYMFGALAAGAWSAGVLHLLAHGAFKALLFLAAGSVIHAVGGATSMRAMGGLRVRLPDTFATMTLGFAALAGVVPLVGFFTKDAVVSGMVDQARDGNLLWPWVAWLLAAAAVVTAALTAAYVARAWLLVFFGAPSPATATAHEPAWTMRLALYLLAVPTVLGGLVVLDPARLLGPAHGQDLFHATTAVLMTVVVVVTALLVLLRWRRQGQRDPWHRPAVRLGSADRAYDVTVVRPVRWLASVVRTGDRDVLDTWADGAGATTRGLGRVLRLAQTGNVQTYLLVVVVGATALAVVAGVRA